MDQMHDNSHRTWLAIASEHENLIPKYVAEYVLPDVKTAEAMRPTLFADSTRKLFPVDSAANTWLSTAYFHKNAEQLPYKPAEKAFVENLLKSAAALWSISEDASAITKAITSKPVEKKASEEDSNYGWVLRDNSGNLITRKYPLFDAGCVKKACDYFDENRDKYPIGIRRHIAKNIMAKAAEYGTKASAAVKREAGYGIPDKTTLMEEIYERAHLAKDAESAILLANINEMVAGLDAEDIGHSLDKVAEVIDSFDSRNGLTKYYGRKIMMPSDFLFDVDLDKAAEAVEDTVELNKYVFSITKLAELNQSVYRDVLGDDFADSIVKKGSEEIDQTKLADNLFSLPKPDKAALEEHLLELFAS